MPTFIVVTTRPYACLLRSAHVECERRRGGARDERAPGGRVDALHGRVGGRPDKARRHGGRRVAHARAPRTGTSTGTHPFAFTTCVLLNAILGAHIPQPQCSLASRHERERQRHRRRRCRCGARPITAHWWRRSGSWRRSEDADAKHVSARARCPAQPIGTLDALAHERADEPPAAPSASRSRRRRCRSAVRLCC